MGLLDRLLGREERNPYAQGDGQPEYGSPAPRANGYGNQQYSTPPPYTPAPSHHGSRAEMTPEQADAAAIERYRYMLRTAPPETIEQAHAEAFAQLSPEQRRQVLDSLSDGLPPGERAVNDDPRSLARMATRAEMRQPGILEQRFGGSNHGQMGGRGMGGGGLGMGGMIAGGLLAGVAGAFVGTAIAGAMFDGDDSGESDSADGGESGADQAQGDSGQEASADSGDGGGFGDFGDFGGGDFGI